MFFDDEGNADTVPAIWVKDNVFEIKETPFRINGVSLDDGVEVRWEPEDLTPIFVRVKQKGGYSTIRADVREIDKRIKVHLEDLLLGHVAHYRLVGDILLLTYSADPSYRLPCNFHLACLSQTWLWLVGSDISQTHMQAEDYQYLYALEQDFWWFAGMREITAAMLDSVCSAARDRLILDAGCGTGGMLSWLMRYAGAETVVGIDLVPDAIKFCREREHERLVQASVTALPFADSTFDLATSFDVLVQLPCEATAEYAMLEMHRVLRPGGIAFIRVAAYGWMKSGHDEALGTQHRYSLHEITGKIERAGFTILRASYANSFLLPVAALRRLLLKRIGLADSGSDVKPLPTGLGWLNSALSVALRGEALLIKHTKINLPAGLSIICLAKKPGE